MAIAVLHRASPGGEGLVAPQCVPVTAGGTGSGLGMDWVYRQTSSAVGELLTLLL